MHVVYILAVNDNDYTILEILFYYYKSSIVFVYMPHK